MKPFITSFFLIVVFLFESHSQNLAIGQWRVHLPFNKARLVTEGNNTIICGAEDGIFIFNKADNSLETITKINGLSDINLSLLRYNSGKDILFVGYENGNIDLIKGKDVYNLPDIKRKNIIGSKRINNLTFFGQYAYLACGFGLVVVDLDKREIKDTYYLTFASDNNSVLGVAHDGNNLYAATDSGVFRANVFDPNINFFGNWTNLNVLPGFIYNHIIWFNNKLYVNFHTANTGNDALYSYDNGTWVNSMGFYELKSVQQANNKLILTGTYDVKVYDSSLQELKYINNLQSLFTMKDAIVDASDIVWIADNRQGLVKAFSSTSLEYIVPDGPRSSKNSAMQIVNGQLWVGHSGPHGNRWDPVYSGEGFSTFVNNEWTTYDKTNVQSPLVSLDSVFDFMSLAVDPRNSNHVFLGSRGKGVVEFENGEIKNYFSEHNSSIQTIPGFTGYFWMGGMAFDADYNLWMVNSNVPNPLLTYKIDGTWESLAFQGIPTTGVLLGAFMIDSYGRMWINKLQNGILVYDPEPGPIVPLLDTGGLASNDVRAFVEDREGQVWIGTSKGICVVYSPNSNPQKVLIFQDGTYQYLLETEAVTAIAVDGANRKWMGTENAGVFLVSEDGTKEIFHFTDKNSPLLSNIIYCIAIDQKTGEVFFGTDRGIISYKSDAIEGSESCENTYVYPNPVYHEYEGPIAIKGVMNNGNIKITDVSGTLVYETKALGGQAIWNGKNFKGDKAHTGVYLVFCSDEDGKNTCITKLLLIN